MKEKKGISFGFLMIQYKLGKLGVRNEAWSEITLNISSHACNDLIIYIDIYEHRLIKN